MTSRRRPKSEEWGTRCPSRSCSWEKPEGEQATLLVPRLGRGRIARRLEGWLKLNPHRVHLDSIGTFVWDRCDGRTSVAEIAHDMRERFGERAEPVEDRLVLFLRQLLRERLVAVDPSKR